MTKNSVVDHINKVIRVHGVNDYGDPIFRVVFSEDQTEKRNGTFNEYYGNIYLRTVNEIKEVSKYPWIHRKWILERWAPGELAYHSDLVLENNKNGVYVCVYVFQDKDQNYLPPLLKVTEIVIKSLLNHKSKSEMAERDEKMLKKEEEVEINEIEEGLKIQSDESKTKDMKSSRESMSVGYVKVLTANEGMGELAEAEYFGNLGEEEDE